MTSWSGVFWIFALFSLYAHATDFPPVRVGFVDAGQPYNIKSKNKLVAGINFEVIQKISSQAQYKADIIGLPKMRTFEFLSSGKIQMLCLYSPEWSKYRGLFIWGPSITTFKEFFITNQSNATLSDYAQLNGKLVGTHLGYRYSNQIMSWFEANQVERVNFTDTTKLYELLAKDRLYAIIDNEFSFSAIRQRYPEFQELRQSALLDKSYDVTCALSKQNPEISQRLLSAMHELKNDGTFETITQKHFGDTN